MKGIWQKVDKNEMHIRKTQKRKEKKRKTLLFMDATCIYNQKLFMWKRYGSCATYMLTEKYHLIPKKWAEWLFPFACVIDSGFSLFLLLRYEVFTEGFCWQPLIITSMFFARLWKGISRRSTLNAQGTGGLKRWKNPSSTNILLYSRQTYWDVELKTLNQWQGTLKCPPLIPFTLRQPSQWNVPLPQRSQWKLNFQDFSLERNLSNLETWGHNLEPNTQVPPTSWSDKV